MGLELLQSEITGEMDRIQKENTLGGGSGGSETKGVDETTDETIARRSAKYWLDLTNEILENTQNAVSGELVFSSSKPVICTELGARQDGSLSSL